MTHSVSRQTPMAVNDWLVADSEEEDEFPPLFPVVGLEASNLASETSAIQTAAFTPDQPRTPQRSRLSPFLLEDGSLFTPPQLPRVGTDSTIGNFTSIPSASGPPSVLAPKPRPRPRPVMKKKAPNSPRNLDVAGTSFSHISDPPTSATKQTNDSIYSATVTSIDFPDVVEDPYSSFDIAERAKMRSRKSQKAKKRIEPPVEINDVIELTSDEDELTLKPTKRQKKQGNPPSEPKAATRPRPKPTLKVKRAPVLPNGSPSNGTALQDTPAPPAQRASSPWQPELTLPTVPPSTPPQNREPTPPSSPPVTITRKRRRIRPSIPNDEDEMDDIGGLPTGDSSSNPVPPPFFDPSSSSLPTDSGVEIPLEPVSSRGKRKQTSSNKKATKTQHKGRKGKKMLDATDEAVDEYTRDQVPHSSALPDIPSFADEHHSPETGQENQLLDDLTPQKRDPPLEHTPATSLQVRSTSIKPKPTPMTDLIRRVNSQPCSPFPNATRTYSPFIKSSRTMLSRIAPLHPNRRTPPPPPPRPPPPKKSKKQLEMEERIEEELSETVEGWSCLTDEERKALRKARIDAELGYE